MWVRSDVTSGRNRRWKWRPDAGDAEDGKTTSDASGRSARASDAGFIFADVFFTVMPKDLFPPEHLSQFTRVTIFGLHEPQMGSEQISHYLNIPPTTLSSTIAKGYEEGKENEGRGRHPKTTKLQDKAMVEEARKNRHTTYFEIAKIVRPNVSTKTVKRRIAQKYLKK